MVFYTNMLYLSSQIVWVQACGVGKCCGGLAGEKRQQLVGNEPGASLLSPQKSKTLSSLSLWFILCNMQAEHEPFTPGSPQKSLASDV